MSEPNNMVTRRPNLIIAISGVLASAILALAVWVLAQMHDDALRRAQDSVFNVSLLVERDVSRNLEIYDLSIRTVIDGLKQSRVMQLDPALRQMVLFDGSASAKDMGSILVIDETGYIAIDSQSLPPRHVYLGDRDYFKVHRDSPSVGLYVSRPFMPRTTGADMSIGLSRRITRPDGSFGGVVVGTMRLKYFRSLFDGMNLGAGGSMALMLSDGTMLMRRPYDPKTIGINLMGTANYSRFVQQPSGDFFGTAAIDGVERWYAFRHIDMYPLILDVALSTRDIYVGWRRRAWIIGSLIGALNLTMIALAVLFAQQIRRRLIAEEELRLLRARELAGAEMIGAPQQAGRLGLRPSRGAGGIGIVAALARLVDDRKDAALAHQPEIGDGHTPTDVDHRIQSQRCPIGRRRGDRILVGRLSGQGALGACRRC